jgi:hypothetical protein
MNEAAELSILKGFERCINEGFCMGFTTLNAKCESLDRWQRGDLLADEILLPGSLEMLRHPCNSLVKIISIISIGAHHRSFA